MDARTKPEAVFSMTQWCVNVVDGSTNKFNQKAYGFACFKSIYTG